MWVLDNPGVSGPSGSLLKLMHILSFPFCHAHWMGQYQHMWGGGVPTRNHAKNLQMDWDILNDPVPSLISLVKYFRLHVLVHIKSGTIFLMALIYLVPSPQPLVQQWHNNRHNNRNTAINNTQHGEVDGVQTNRTQTSHPLSKVASGRTCRYLCFVWRKKHTGWTFLEAKFRLFYIFREREDGS
jgi:hypothetical protein